jgi:hypothetical protein
MSTQQAFINGFVKRAAQYGYNHFEAVNILKAAELKGDQHKLDVDKDGKIEGSDLKKLRQRKQAADGQVAQPPAQVSVTPNAPNPEDRNSINYKLQEFLLGGKKEPTTAVPGAAPVSAGSLKAMAPAPVTRVNRGNLVGGAPITNMRSSTPPPAPVKRNVPFFSNEGIQSALGLPTAHLTPASVDARDKPGAFSGAPAQASKGAYKDVLGK